MLGVPQILYLQRTAPGLDGYIYTPRDTYLLVDPAKGIFAPKLTWGAPPAGYAPLGTYGNSTLYAPIGTSVSNLEAVTYQAVTGKPKPWTPTYGFPSGGKTPTNPLALYVQPGNTLYMVPGGGKPGTAQFDASGGSLTSMLQPATPPQGGTSPGLTPAQQAAQDAATSQAGAGKTEPASSNTGLLVVLGLAAVGLGAWALTRKKR